MRRMTEVWSGKATLYNVLSFIKNFFNDLDLRELMITFKLVESIKTFTTVAMTGTSTYTLEFEPVDNHHFIVFISQDNINMRVKLYLTVVDGYIIVESIDMPTINDKIDGTTRMYLSHITSLDERENREYQARSGREDEDE